MQVIWKYQVPISDHVDLTIPGGGVILSAQIQGGQPCIWVLVDPQAPLVLRSIHILGTGYPTEKTGDWKFIDTLQSQGGSLVFHIFDGGETHL